MLEFDTLDDLSKKRMNKKLTAYYIISFILVFAVGFISYAK